jgi:hypothetical protein
MARARLTDLKEISLPTAVLATVPGAKGRNSLRSVESTAE